MARAGCVSSRACYTQLAPLHSQARHDMHVRGDTPRPIRNGHAQEQSRHSTHLEVWVGSGVVPIVLALERVRVQDQEVDVVLGLAQDLKAERSSSQAGRADS